MITCLLVERLGVGGGGGDVSVTSSLVGTSGLLEGLSGSQVSGTSGVVRGGVVGHEVEGVGKGSEHCERLVAGGHTVYGDCYLFFMAVKAECHRIEATKLQPLHYASMLPQSGLGAHCGCCAARLSPMREGLRCVLAPRLLVMQAFDRRIIQVKRNLKMLSKARMPCTKFGKNHEN